MSADRFNVERPRACSIPAEQIDQICRNRGSQERPATIFKDVDMTWKIVASQRIV